MTDMAAVDAMPEGHVAFTYTDSAGRQRVAYMAAPLVAARHERKRAVAGKGKRASASASASEPPEDAWFDWQPPAGPSGTSTPAARGGAARTTAADWRPTAGMSDNECAVSCAVVNGVIDPGEGESWLRFLDRLPAAEVGPARMALLPGSGVGGLRPDEPPRKPAAAARPAAGAGAPQLRPVAHAGTQTTMLRGPQSAAEMAQVLGPRPGGDYWFTGEYAQGPLGEAQRTYDAQVASAMSAEEWEANEVAFLMNSPRALTEAQARAEIAARGDNASKAAPLQSDTAAWNAL